MKKSGVLIVLTIFVYQLLPAQCPNILWGDEFSGNSLDLASWNYQVGDGCAEGICGWGNNELQSYQEANVAVSNGTLQITALKKRVKGKKYTSGRINTKNKVDHTYGRFEASIKLPLGDGLWPAFWMLSTTEPYGGWPQSGEIDIMEFVASDPGRSISAIHYGDLYPNNQFQTHSFQLANGLFPDAFHDFAIEWEAGELRWFVDDILYAVKKTADVSPYSWPFDHDFHMLLNVAVGGNLGGPVDDNLFPATMEVDYVRVFDGFRPYIQGDMVVDNMSQNEIFSLGNIASNVNVTWTVPSDAIIVSGQGTSQLTVDFGSASGDVTASFDDGCEARIISIPVTVEAPFVKAFSFENFDDPATAVFSSSTGLLTEIANPSPNPINGSALSGQYIRNSGEQFDVLVYDVSNIPDGSEYVDRLKKFVMDVYTSAPIGTEILLQLETADASPTNFPAGRHSRYLTTITETSNWERLAFSLLDRPDGAASDTDITTMILLFNSNTFTGDTYYFDNLDSYSIDQGGGNNQAPVVAITSPGEGQVFDEGTLITVTADATDSDGSISEVEFYSNGNSIGTDNSAPYSVTWNVANGNNGLSAIATDNEGASTTSTIINVTGQATGNPTSVHVLSITPGTANAGQGNKYGVATVAIVDDLGNPISGATVLGAFSGTYNEQASGVTGIDGTVTIQTQSTAKGNVNVIFCVDDVQYNLLPYNPSNNVVTCSSEGARVASNLGLIKVSVAPNPAKDWVSIQMTGFKADKTISIFDLSGKKLISFISQSTQETIDISSIPEGLYLINVVDGEGNNQAEKLIK